MMDIRLSEVEDTNNMVHNKFHEFALLDLAGITIYPSIIE